MALNADYYSCWLDKSNKWSSKSWLYYKLHKIGSANHNKNF